jgi:hypothetical protein
VAALSTLSDKSLTFNPLAPCFSSGFGDHRLNRPHIAFGPARAPIGVQQKLMRHANVSATMNVYGNLTLRAKQVANSKVVQIVMKHEAA